MGLFLKVNLGKKRKNCVNVEENLLNIIVRFEFMAKY